MLKNDPPKRTDPPIGLVERLHPSANILNHSRRWSAANTIPRRVVTPSHRTLASRRPAWAAATAASMVRLLVSRTTVMTIPLMMVGLNANGRVQFGLPTRR